MIFNLFVPCSFRDLHLKVYHMYGKLNKLSGFTFFELHRKESHKKLSVN